tara:strand:- start:256 stop:663 length:408 start_codon:yes stop_codon:yes gene_type:complete
MFNIKEFENVYKLLKKENINEAKKNLIQLRDEYTLHPDYLFLMAEQLILEDRVYQAIDTLHSSLLIDYDDNFLKKNKLNKSTKELIQSKFKLLHKLFKVINNDELAKDAENADTDNKKYLFFKKLQDLMPGVGFK